MLKFRWLFLIVTALCVSSCYLPMGFHGVEYDSGTNPFDKIRVLNDQGHLEVIISDDEDVVKQIRITQAKCFDGDKRYIPTTLVPGSPSHQGGSQEPIFWFKMNFENDRFFIKPPFYLKIQGFRGNTPFVVNAKFTDQVHYQMIDVLDSLDHG